MLVAWLDYLYRAVCPSARVDSPRWRGLVDWHYQVIEDDFMIPDWLALIGDFLLTGVALTCADGLAVQRDTVGNMNETPTNAPTMGLAEAAKACGVSVSTMRRRKDLLVAAGARITDKGWKIPIPALVSLGLMDSRTAPEDTAPAVDVEPTTVAPDDRAGSQAIAEVEELRRLLAAAEARAQVAEAIATERERIIEIQAQALRILEPGQSAAPKVPITSTAETSRDIPDFDTPIRASERPAAGRLRRLLGFGSNRHR